MLWRKRFQEMTFSSTHALPLCITLFCRGGKGGWVKGYRETGWIRQECRRWRQTAPRMCRKKIDIYFFFSFFITYENHLLISVLKEALSNLWKLLSTLAALKSHPTGLMIQFCFKKSYHWNHSYPAWCKKKKFINWLDIGTQSIHLHLSSTCFKCNTGDI